MEQLAPDLKALLTKTRLKDLVAKKVKPLVALGHRVNIGTVLDTLSEHGLLSAPVFISNGEGNIHPSVATLIGFVDTWAVLAAFLQSVGNSSDVSAHQLETQGEALCDRPVLDLFQGSSALRTATDSEDELPACADWDMHDDPESSLLEVIRSCFLPRAPGTSSLSSWASGAGFALSAAAAAMSPRPSLGNAAAAPGPAVAPAATAATAGGAAEGGSSSAAAAAAGGGGSSGTNNGGGGASPGPCGHSRHPAASHRIVVLNPEVSDQPLTVLSQSDILRFLAGHHESLRPLGKASLAELGLATGSLNLAAGPLTSSGGAGARPPPLHTPAGGSGGNNSGVLTPGAHLPPSSPKPPLAGGGYNSSAFAGGGGLLGTFSGISASPVQESHMFNLLQRANSSGSTGGGDRPTVMGMSPPASPRVSLDRLSAGLHGTHSLSGAGLHCGGGGHRMASRRQLVAVHESVTALEAFRVLLQQRVSAVAVLSGVGSSANMRLVGNLSASDLRHLKPGGFGRLALSVKQFLASKPVAPDQAIPLRHHNMSPPSTDSRVPGGSSNSSSPSPTPKTPVVMAHAPGVYTCQATASLEELVKMLGAPQRSIHRVYVVDPDQRPAGVVTGTDVLSLLSAACNRE